jgi:hypothetical protein
MTPSLESWKGRGKDPVSSGDDDTQQRLSVSGAVMREKAMPVKAGFKMVSEVPRSSIMLFSRSFPIWHSEDHAS